MNWTFSLTPISVISAEAQSVDKFRQKVATDLRAVGAVLRTRLRTRLFCRVCHRSRLSPTRRPEVGGYLNLELVAGLIEFPNKSVNLLTSPLTFG